MQGNLNVDPKHANIVWESKRYRDFIQSHYTCYCGSPLSFQQGWLHHHRNTGGKTPLDQFLTRWCKECHEKIHATHKTKDGLYSKWKVSDESIEKDCVEMLFNYIRSHLDSTNLLLNHLTQVAIELE